MGWVEWSRTHVISSHATPPVSDMLHVGLACAGAHYHGYPNGLLLLQVVWCERCIIDGCLTGPLRARLWWLMWGCQPEFNLNHSLRPPAFLLLRAVAAPMYASLMKGWG
jgi:hypothetical protein